MLKNKITTAEKRESIAIPPLLVGAGLIGSIALVPVENKRALTK